jgi:hypothetical protein
VSYFRPQQAGKIGPRTVYSFSDSTSRLSQNAGQVKTARVPIPNCLNRGVHPNGACPGRAYVSSVFSGNNSATTAACALRFSAVTACVYVSSVTRIVE